MDIKQQTIVDEVLEFLTSRPTLEEIIAFKPSEGTVERMRYLLDKNKNGNLSETESRELDQMEQMDHIMILLKARARKKLDG